MSIALLNKTNDVDACNHARHKLRDHVALYYIALRIDREDAELSGCDLTVPAVQNTVDEGVVDTVVNARD